MKEGIYFDMPFEEYSKVKAFSNSGASLLEESPATYYQWCDYPERKQTPAMNLGIAIHDAVFNPEGFNTKKSVAISPTFGRSNTDKEAKAQFLEQNKSKIIIDEEDYQKCLEVSQAVLTKKTAKYFLTDARKEVSIFWKCPESGVLCKGRIDAWNQKLGVVIDLKTTSSSLHDYSLQKIIHTMRYYRQLAWYSYGLDLLGEVPENQLFIFVQTKPPYLTAFKMLGFNAYEQGKREMKESVKKYSECLKSSKWEGFPDQVSIIELPTYAVTYDQGNGQDFNDYEEMTTHE